MAHSREIATNMHILLPLRRATPHFHDKWEPQGQKRAKYSYIFARRERTPAFLRQMGDSGAFCMHFYDKINPPAPLRTGVGSPKPPGAKAPWGTKREPWASALTGNITPAEHPNSQVARVPRLKHNWNGGGNGTAGRWLAGWQLAG